MALIEQELAAINTRKGLLQLLETKNVNALAVLRYERELAKLEI